MRFEDKETVDGTDITIGRRIERKRGADGVMTDRVLSTYTAEYREPGTRERRIESLGVTTKREARRRAIEIQTQLEEGVRRRRPGKITVDQLIERFSEFNRTKGLASRSLAKYHADLDKLRRFCQERNIVLARSFGETEFYGFCEWLTTQGHKQGTTYASKTRSTAATIVLQAFKWGWRQKLLPEYALSGVRIPPGRARQQPCPTLDEVEAIASRLAGEDSEAVLVAVYAGLRVQEICQLRWEDIVFRDGVPATIHVRRGGADGPKDREARFVPLHERLKPVFDKPPPREGLVFPSLRDRTLLTRLKAAAKAAGFQGRITTHSLRHTFASTAAQRGIPMRLVLAWLGHASSATFEQYFHQLDEESAAAMHIMSSWPQRNGHHR